MDTLVFVAVLFFSIGYTALMVMFTIKKRRFSSAIKEMAEKLEEERQNSSKLWHQLDDAYHSKEELAQQLSYAEKAWEQWEANYRRLLETHTSALERGEELKTSFIQLRRELRNTELLSGQYYEELQNKTELLKVIEWAAKTKVIAAKPRVIKALPPSVAPRQERLNGLLIGAALSPQLKRMLGL